MRLSFLRLALLVFLVSSLIIPTAVGQSNPDKQALLKKISAAYYSYKQEGITGFECNGIPEWDKFLAENFKDGTPPAEPIAKRLKLAQASVSMSEAGAPTANMFLTDGSDIDDNLSDLADTAGNAITGFIQSWWPFVFDSPLEGIDSDANVREEGSGYRIEQKQGAAETSMLLDKSFVVLEKDILLQGGSIILKPKFIQTPKGLLLSNLESQISATQQHISMTVEYQSVPGSEVRVPAKVSYKTTAPGRQTVAVEVTFGKYKFIKG